MLAFSTTEQQSMLVDAISKYANNQVRKAAHEADEHNEFPLYVVLKGWEIGVLPAAIPKAYGGFGEYSAVTNVLAAEELAYGDLSVAMAVLAPGLVALPVLFSGTEEQKQNILPGIGEATPPPLTSAL